MPKRDASKTKENVLNFIKAQVKLNGYPPSVREICYACNIKSTSTVHAYINKLTVEGHLEKQASLPRAIKIMEDESLYDTVVNVPILGKVAAGVPIMASENLDGSFTLPTQITGEGADVFILKVKGDSMIEAGILEGDFITIRQQNTALNGDIVVAMIDDEVTVKRFYKEKNHVRLQPENSKMQPILVKSGLQILGKVVAVIRKI